MELKFTPQRSDRKVDYKLETHILEITENGKTKKVNVQELDEEHEFPIVKVTSDSVTVIRFYSSDEKEHYEKT